jgi:hypothetical protein
VDQSPLLVSADAALALYEPVLRFKAAYLIEKLLKERIVDTAEEGEALFAEAKKFLIMSHMDSDVSWNMYSTRVDEAWHQFVLFTKQYVDFCHRYFGQYMHHNPSNAPGPVRQPELEVSTFESFRVRYETIFREPLPDIWLDDRSVCLARRVINDDAGRSQVWVEHGMACLAREDGAVELSVSDIACDALDFISRTGSFYVRELPGDLTDEEKVGLVATLVEHHLLRVAP